MISANVCEEEEREICDQVPVSTCKKVQRYLAVAQMSFSFVKKCSRACMQAFLQDQNKNNRNIHDQTLSVNVNKI